MLASRLKSIVKNTVLRRGYEVRKAHPEAYTGVKVLDVFGLALRELAARKGGNLTFVEIGANDGLGGDYLGPRIEKYGLRGVFVEPQPAVFARLKENYRGVSSVAFENCAIGSEEGSLTLFCAELNSQKNGYASSLTSSTRAKLEDYAKANGGKVVAVEVPCITPHTLLQKYGFERIDILQIDTEGMDFEILQAFDLKTVAPEIIHYETGQMEPSEQKKSYQYLSDHGYEVLTHQGDTLAIPATS